MIIHKEGQILVLTTLISAIVLYVILAVAPAISILCETILGITGILLLCFMFFFFRNPSRKIITDESVAFAPADGKIVAIEDVYESEYLNMKCRKVSIFMSIYNVHVNRYPVSGKICYSKYHPGRYFIASYPKSSELNEHHSTVIEKADGALIMVKQIAGALARRIICYAKVGNHAEQGEDIGFIRFGSRVDLFLPLNAEILVKMNEKVKGNRTVIAQFNF